MQLTHGPIPLYYQLEQHLGDRIAKRDFAPGALLPTEEQLCEEYGVSRITVRRALDSLLLRRLIVRKRGVGTFVSKPEAAQHSVRLKGSLEDALSYTSTLMYRVLKLGPATAPQRVREILGLGKGAESTRLEVIALLKKQPFAYSELYFPPDVGALLKASDIESGVAVVFTVERKLNERIDRAEQTIVPMIASPVVARHLKIKPGTPILEVLRTYYTTSGRAIESVVGRYHPERFTYLVDLFPGKR